MKRIKEFQGDYRWLSNFWPTKVEYEGRVFASVEHAYCYAKAFDPEWRSLCMDGDNTPGKIKRAGRRIELRDDWDDIKEKVMESCLRSKFQDPALRMLLIATGDAEIFEGNTWGDYFWGVDLYSGYGHNKLGKLLMSLRSEFTGGV